MATEVLIRRPFWPSQSAIFSSQTRAPGATRARMQMRAEFSREKPPAEKTHGTPPPPVYLEKENGVDIPFWEVQGLFRWISWCYLWHLMYTVDGCEIHSHRESVTLTCMSRESNHSRVSECGAGCISWFQC